MNDWAVGLSTGSFYQTSIFECLEPISAAGFHLIEVCSAPSHLDYHDLECVRRAAARLHELGLEAESFHAPFADHIDITAPDLRRRASEVKEVLAAVEAAAAVRARHFVIHPGPERAHQPAGEERLQRLQNVAVSLREIAERCHELGMLCVLENKLPHLLFGNLADMMWILGAMNATEVGVCLDTGHAQLAGDLEHAPHALSSRLRLIHASDNAGRYDDHLPPGQGLINWDGVLQRLRNENFHGAIIIEIAARGEPAEILQAAQRARIFLKERGSAPR
jgi:sugar phosphate isomerase/epimerase